MCLCVTVGHLHTGEVGKTGEPIEMPFGSAQGTIIRWGLDLPREWAILGVVRPLKSIETVFAVVYANTAEPIEMPLGGTHVGARNHLSDGVKVGRQENDNLAIRPFVKIL